MTSAEVVEAVPPLPDTFTGSGVLTKFTEETVDVAFSVAVATTVFSLLKFFR